MDTWNPNGSGQELLPASEKWEKSTASDELFQRLVSAGRAWDACANGLTAVAKAKAQIKHELLGVASSRDDMAIAGAARRWYRETRSPYFVILNLPELLVYQNPKTAAFDYHPLAPWQVLGNRLILGEGYDPKPIWAVTGPSQRWRKVFGPLESPRTDLASFLTLWCQVMETIGMYMGIPQNAFPALLVDILKQEMPG